MLFSPVCFSKAGIPSFDFFQLRCAGVVHHHKRGRSESEQCPLVDLCKTVTVRFCHMADYLFFLRNFQKLQQIILTLNLGYHGGVGERGSVEDINRRIDVHSRFGRVFQYSSNCWKVAAFISLFKASVSFCSASLVSLSLVPALSANDFKLTAYDLRGIGRNNVGVFWLFGRTSAYQHDEHCQY